MRKIFLMLLMSMLALTQAFASVGVKLDGAMQGTATDLNFPSGTTVANDGSTFTITPQIGPIAAITSGTIAGATINSSIIGGSSAAAGSFTTLSASGATALSTTLGVTGISTLTGRLNANGGVDVTSAGALAIGATTATSVVITPATTITGALTETGAATFNGAVTLGDAVTDINTITGKIAGATPLTFDGATADTVYTILAVDDPASSSKTVTLPAVTGTVKLTGAAIALTPASAVTLTVAKGTTLYTDTVTDNEDETITFSGAGAAGDEATIIFTTAGTADEVITFHATLVSSTGTLTLGTDAGKYYAIRFISNGSHWFEVSRTAVQT